MTASGLQQILYITKRNSYRNCASSLSTFLTFLAQGKLSAHYRCILLFGLSSLSGFELSFSVSITNRPISQLLPAVEFAGNEMPWLHNHWLSLSVGRAGRLLRKAPATAKLPRVTQSQVFFNYDSWVGQNHHVISHPVGWKSIATHRTNLTDKPRRTNLDGRIPSNLQILIS